MVQFHPLYTYFGRLPLRLDRDDPDPMSVLTIERLPIAAPRRSCARALAGTLEEVKGMSLDRGVASLSVDADPAVEVQMDGEHYGLVTHLVATARPASLAIAVPQSDSPR
jgi:hypothetical protein